MATLAPEELRCALSSTMQDNGPAGCEVEVEGWVVVGGGKSESLEFAVSRPGSRLLGSDEQRPPLTPVAGSEGSSSLLPPPSHLETLFKSEQGEDEELEDAPVGGHPTSDGSDSAASDSASSSEEADALFAPMTVTVGHDKDAESAIMALLALQREPSPPADPSRDSSPERRRRPASPGGLTLSRQSSICKPDTASRFYCKFPKCGKAYASTDAVRKHCRQRHLDWLRRLGHGCPALDCRWED